jgi:hypothetical protein
MADTAQALNPADTAGEVDDGFTAEERTAFDQMRDATSDPAPAPTPEPTPAPAPAAADAGGEDDDDEEDAGAAPVAGAAPAQPAADGTVAPVVPKRRVSARKYERAEEARKVAERERDDMRQSQARLDERLRILNEALTPVPAATAEAEEDAEPDADQDIFAWVNWKKRDDARFRAEIAERQTSQQTRMEEQDLSTAYQVLMANRTFELAQYFFQKDLTENGVALTDDEVGKIRQTIAGEERELVSGAIKNKRSPAKAVLALAKARGFRPTAAAPAPKPNGVAAPATGAVAAPAAVPGALNTPVAAPRVEDEIARIREGSEAARSLSTGGGAPPNPLTPEKLANMSDDEFAHMVESMSPDQERQLFGA